MIIAMKKSPTDVILSEGEIPAMSETSVKIKILSCGVCGGDLNSSPEYKIFGHEMAGIVTEIGSHVSNVAVGDRVVVESTAFCGVCNDCRDGRVDLCNNVTTIAGGFAEFAVVPARNCVILPEDISFKQAGILEPLGVAIDLVKTADIKLGDHVLIYGAGSIGLMALQLAKRSGASKIYAVLRSHSKRKAELAMEFGAEDVIYSDQIDLADYKFPKGGVDKALITARNYVIPETLDILNYGGTASFLGFGGDPMITINANTFHVRKLQLRASYARPGIYIPLAMETVRSGIIDTEKMISHTMPLSDIQELMNIAGTGRDKVVKAVMLAE